MFKVHCPGHGSDVLLDERRITGLASREGRILVRWVCWCGHVGTHRTGRGRPAERHR